MMHPGSYNPMQAGGYDQRRWGDPAWEKGGHGGWQPTYGSNDPYTWWQPQPVATPARWAAWGAVDRALEQYLHPQHQRGEVVSYQYAENPLHPGEFEEEGRTAREWAADAASHADQARGAANRMTLGGVGELVESVGNLADTVRRMEERSAIVHERDAARLRVLELETALATQAANKMSNIANQHMNSTKAAAPPPPPPPPTQNNPVQEFAARGPPAAYHEPPEKTWQDKHRELLAERQAVMAERQLAQERRALEQELARPFNEAPQAPTSGHVPGMIPVELAETKAQLAKLEGAYEALKQAQMLQGTPVHHHQQQPPPQQQQVARPSTPAYVGEARSAAERTEAAAKQAQTQREGAASEVAALRLDLEKHQAAMAAQQERALAQAEAGRVRAEAEADAQRLRHAAELDAEKAKKKNRPDDDDHGLLMGRLIEERVAAEAFKLHEKTRQLQADLDSARKGSQQTLRRVAELEAAEELERQRSEARLDQLRQQLLESQRPPPLVIEEVGHHQQNHPRMSRTPEPSPRLQQQQQQHKSESPPRSPLVKSIAKARAAELEELRASGEFLLNKGGKPASPVGTPARGRGLFKGEEHPHKSPRRSPSSSGWDADRLDRAVKVTWQGQRPPPEALVRTAMHHYGRMERCTVLQHSAVVLFEHRVAAELAVLHYQGLWRLRSMSKMLLPAPRVAATANNTSPAPPALRGLRKLRRSNSGPPKFGHVHPNPTAVLLPKEPPKLKHREAPVVLAKPPPSVGKVAEYGQRTLIVKWDASAAPRDNAELERQFKPFGFVKLSGKKSRHRGIVMYDSKESADRAVRDYRGPWRITKAAQAPSTWATPAVTGSSLAPVAEESFSPAASTTSLASWTSSTSPSSLNRVADRSVLAKWKKRREAAPTEAELGSALAPFGTVLRCRAGPKSGVVLFAQASEARRAVDAADLFDDLFSLELCSDAQQRAAPHDAKADDRAPPLSSSSSSSSSSRIPPPTKKETTNPSASSCVKVTWPASATPPSQRQIETVLGRYAEAKRCSVKSTKSAIVLFGSKEEAANVVRRYQGPWKLRLVSQPDVRSAPPTSSSAAAAAPAAPKPPSTVVQAVVQAAAPPLKKQAPTVEPAPNNKKKKTRARHSAEELELRTSKEADPRDHVLAERCVKTAWDSKSSTAPTASQLNRLLANVDLCAVTSVVRKQSAVLMFAHANDADRAVTELEKAQPKWTTQKVSQSSQRKAAALPPPPANNDHPPDTPASEHLEHLDLETPEVRALRLEKEPPLEEPPSLGLGGPSQAKQARRDEMAQELAQDPPNEPLEARCLKLSFNGAPPPKKLPALTAKLGDLGVVFVRAVLRKKSAIVLFASGDLAASAVAKINAGTTWKAAIASTATSQDESSYVGA